MGELEQNPKREGQSAAIETHLLQDQEYIEAIPLPLRTLSLSITSAESQTKTKKRKIKLEGEVCLFA